MEKKKKEVKEVKKENKDDKKNIKKTDRVLNNILLIVVLILLIYILFLTGAIKITTKNVKVESDKVKDTNTKVKLETNDDEVQTLYKSVELGRKYEALRHYYFYSEDEVYAKYMDSAFIKEMALSKLTIDNTAKIDASILEAGYKNIVGSNSTYRNRSFETICSYVKYDPDSNTYTVNKNDTCDTTNKDGYQFFDKITSAYKYNDRIEINARVGYAEEEKEKVSDGVYSSTGKTIIKKDMDSATSIGTFSESLDEIKKLVDYSKLTRYKYTFKLENTRYYFYKVERVDD